MIWWLYYRRQSTAPTLTPCKQDVIHFPVLTETGTIMLIYYFVIHALGHELESWKVWALEWIISWGRGLTVWLYVTASSVTEVLWEVIHSQARKWTFGLTRKISLFYVQISTELKAVMTGLEREVLRGGGTRDATTWGQALNFSKL